MIKELLAVLYPPRCPVCDSVMLVGERLCGPECEKKLPLIKGNRCMRCGKPVESEATEYCYECENGSFYADKGLAIWSYDAVMRESIARFKYKGRQEYALFYAKEALRHAGWFMKQCAPDILVPVPLHKKRMQTRGYNQAERISAQIERLTGIPSISLLARVKNTLPQKELNDKSRAKNVGSAFAIAEKSFKALPELPDTVMLVDDIFTTGSTVEACAKVLKEAGVRRVVFLTLCMVL